MIKDECSASMRQIQAELSDLLIKVDGLPARDREHFTPVLEKIYAQLHELSAGTPTKNHNKVEVGLSASEADPSDQQTGPPEKKQSKDKAQKVWFESFESFCTHLSIVFYEWDLQTNQMRFSKGLEQITSLPGSAEPNHRKWLKQIFEEDREKVEPVMAKIQLERTSGKTRLEPVNTYEFEYRLLDRNSNLIPVWDRGIVERDPQGKPLRVIGMVQDISRLKHAQRSLSLSFQALVQSNVALRKKEEQVRSALVNVPVAFFQTDKDLRYTWMFSPMLEESIEEFIGKRDDEIIPGDSLSELLKLKQDSLSLRVRIRRELTISLEGQDRQVFVAVQPVFDEQQDPTGLVGMYVDITEQRILENMATEKAFKLELSRRLMEQREHEYQEIGRFLQNGPIQDLSGMGFALQLARQLFPGPDALNVLEQLKDEIKNLVIELRQVSNELRPPGVTRFGLSRALQSYTEEFQIKNPNIHINLALTDSGAGLTDHTVQTLFRIIEESFKNIVNHASASEVAVNLAIQPEKIRMEIRDNGRGFKGQPDWMQLTRQGHFGLVRMRESAEALGGTLDINSGADSGTVVVAEVPIPMVE